MPARKSTARKAPARRAAKSNVMRCKTSFSGDRGHGVVTHLAGELVRASDPAVKDFPEMFVTVDEFDAALQVQEATAAPGEQRP